MYADKIPFIQQNIRENVVLTTDGVKELPQIIKEFKDLQTFTRNFSDETNKRFRKSQLQLDEAYRNLDITHNKTVRERADLQITTQKFMRYMAELKYFDM